MGMGMISWNGLTPQSHSFSIWFKAHRMVNGLGIGFGDGDGLSHTTFVFSIG